MTSGATQSNVARQIRDVGARFVERNLGDIQLSETTAQLNSLTNICANGKPRARFASRYETSKFANTSALLSEVSAETFLTKFAVRD